MSNLDAAWKACRPTDVYAGTLPLFVDPFSGLYVRDRGDVGIIREQMTDYRAAESFHYDSNSLLLDLGGHLGDSAWYFRKYLNKVGRVLSVEADPRNASLYRLNWNSDNSVELIEAAVCSGNQKWVNLYLGKTYSGDNSLEGYRGRASIPVRTIPFRNLLDRQPNIIKCDIEGGEFLLNWSDIPSSVTEIFMEMHQNRPEWIKKGRELDAAILAQGFKHTQAPKHEELFLRRQIAVWSRR